MFKLNFDFYHDWLKIDTNKFTYFSFLYLLNLVYTEWGVLLHKLAVACGYIFA
jgi:hypothetical protein